MAWYDENGKLDLEHEEMVDGARLANIMQLEWLLMEDGTVNAPHVEFLCKPLQEVSMGDGLLCT